ncbi:MULTISPECIES: HEPN domain-containing protein [unclassified Bradyrhizobium]|uniref:ApeA N-terminal domain 1-containing protein n=1 Tax=unclassified Bradyrhizobium TaxID=2631580 RepID=UPI001FF78308|nr:MULTISPECIES: HEPN domain-containing protein [unclassified Bradyrhizobium]MCK1422622.1 hypothetical protein [Bradyrhizobium sp. CW12]MCK1644677.1 hypothetical protein [Bradyrhizobium sp. 154]
MPESVTIDRLKSHPVVGTWFVLGSNEEFPGVLYFEDDNLRLTLYLTIDGNTPFEILTRTDPRLMPFAPPNQPTLHGRTKAAGHVTLFNCPQLTYQSAVQLDPPLARVELTLGPSQAWSGSGFVSAEEPYQELSFRAPGLHNILSTIDVDHQFLVESKPKRKSPTHKLKKLTGADEAILVHHREQPKAQIVRADKSFEIQFASSISQNSSSLDGISITTSDSVYILSQGATLTELVNVAYEVEQFLALLCIGPFRGERVALSLDMIHRAELIWKMGKQNRSARFSLMPHQMLVPLGRHPGLARQALERWFAASESTRLARWLIFDALFTEVSSTSKFLSVAQAWEIAGREESKAAPYNKQQFRAVCREVEKIFNNQLGEDAAKRLLQLLRSSNRESFANFVQNMIKDIPQLALDQICRDRSDFVSAVVKTRNVLTHMQDGKNLPIEVASYLSLFLTYKLIVLYCIHACITMGLPLDNLAGMLGNNTMAQTACRPLPSI